MLPLVEARNYTSIELRCYLVDVVILPKLKGASDDADDVIGIVAEDGATICAVDFSGANPRLDCKSAAINEGVIGDGEDIGTSIEGDR